MSTLRPNVRTEDPEGSQLAAEGDEARWTQHRELLLIAWYRAHRAGKDGLTDLEAGEAAGLAEHYHHKRAGELRQPERAPRTWAAEAGAPLIAWTGVMRKSHLTGRSRGVSAITERGIEYLREHDLLPEDAAELRKTIEAAITACERGALRHEVLDILRGGRTP
jgi:hypothetical protein